ncbi:MAG: Gldg family protein [Deltaproteobacteria bacterium]
MTKPRKGFDFQKTTLSIIGLIVLLLILVVANIIVSYANVRWDATEGKTYSLSKGTLNILADMNRPVTVKFFYSKSNPDVPADIKLYAKRVKDFLYEYEQASNDMIRVETYDPKPDSDEEEWAQKYGVRGIGVPGGEKIYCGLVFVCADKEETIGWLDTAEEQLLEYNITRIIQGLQRTKKIVIGVISGLPVFGNPQRPPMARQGGGEPWLFIQELKKSYEVKEIGQNTVRIDPAINLIMIIFPKNITPELRYAVDQYVLSGGKALVFVDPLCVSDNSQRQPYMAPMGASLKELFKAWGISMDAKKAIADFGQPTQVRGREGVEDNPLMISARGDAFSGRDIVTSGLESMLFPVAGAIEKEKSASCTFEPLVMSSENAGLMEAFNAYLGLEAIKKDFKSAHKRFNIAVRIRGTFKTAFPSGPPKNKDEKNTFESATPGDHLKESVKPATLIVVSDADMLADHFYVRKRQILGFAVSEMFNDNLNFVANASEILTGSDDLIGLRTRGTFQRPFTAVLELKRRAQDRWLAKEKELVKRVEEANEKLRRLERQKDKSQEMIMSPEQEAEIAKFKTERDRINDELKDVRKKLRAEIETLGTVLKAINIFLMPFLIAMIGTVFAIYRHRKMKRK